MYDTPPAGWIPPQFREYIYAPFTNEDIDNIMYTTGIYDEDGNFRRYTREEIIHDYKKCIGVKDTRTGKIRYNSNTFYDVDV